MYVRFHEPDTHKQRERDRERERYRQTDKHRQTERASERQTQGEIGQEKKSHLTAEQPHPRTPAALGCRRRRRPSVR